MAICVFLPELPWEHVLDNESVHSRKSMFSKSEQILQPGVQGQTDSNIHCGRSWFWGVLQQYLGEGTGYSLLKTNWLHSYFLLWQPKEVTVLTRLCWWLINLIGSGLIDAPLGESGGYFFQGLTKQGRPSPSGQPTCKQVWEIEYGCFLPILAPCWWTCPLCCCFHPLLALHPGFFSLLQASSRPLASDWDFWGVHLNRSNNFEFSALSGMQTAIIRLPRLYCVSQLY